MGTGGVFINYRGSDSHANAELLDRDLVAAFGRELVFLDCYSLPVGADYVRELLDRVRGCQVLLVVMGPTWLASTTESGDRRIDDPADWIHREIAEAFAAGVRVVPVLLGETTLPAENELPAPLAGLARCQAVVVRPGHTRSDIEDLVCRLREVEPALRAVAPPVNPPASTTDTSAAKRRGPVTLPPRPEGFAGRGADVAALLDWLDPAAGRPVATAAVTGMAGVGKTTLAVHLAHAALDRNWYPGGILYLDVHGYSDQDRMSVADIAAQLLRQLHETTTTVPADASDTVPAWRTRTRRLAAAGTPLLVVLDNVADSDQVEPLLLDAPHRVVVTSRRAQSAMAAKQVRVATLTEDEAIELLDRAVRIADPNDDRITRAPAHAHRLAEVCGRLPLALSIVAAQLQERSLPAVLDELTDTRKRLDKLGYRTSDKGPMRAVRAALELSYTRLGEQEARMFRMLAAVPGPEVSTETASVLVDRDEATAGALLGELARTNLVAHDGNGARWQAHDLVRLLARDQAERHPGEFAAAWVRLIVHYLDRVGHAERMLRGAADEEDQVFGAEADALAWLDRERVTLVGLATHATRGEPPGVATCLSRSLRQYFARRHHVADWLLVSDAAMAELDRLPEEFDAQRPAVVRDRAAALVAARRFDDAIAVLRSPLAGTPDLTTICDLGTALAEAGRTAEAIATLRHAADLASSRGSRSHAAAIAIAIANTTGRIHQRAGQHAQAVAHFDEAVAMARERGDLPSEARILDNLVESLMATDRIDAAVTAFDRAFTLLHSAGDTHQLAVAAARFGSALADKGDHDVALSYCRSAALILRREEDRHAEAACWRIVLRCLAAVPGDETMTELAGGMIECFRATHDHLGERDTWELAGPAAERTGDIDTAVVAYQGLVAGYADGRWTDARREIRALFELGRLLRRRNHDADDLIDLYGRATRRAGEIPDTLLQAQATFTLAALLADAGRLAESVENLRRAEELAVGQDTNLAQVVLDTLARVRDEVDRTALHPTAAGPGDTGTVRQREDLNSGGRQT